MRGKIVLDIACGNGYGLRILADAGAGSVVGVDSASDVIQEDLAEHTACCVADGTTLPFTDGSFEIVTSFETIEHIDSDRAFVSELRRVLTVDGLLVLSTPNAVHSRRRPGPPNPFHVREYEPQELQQLLATEFSRVSLLGQETHPRYPFSPFWQLKDQLPKDSRGRAGVISWKLQNRFPFGAKDRLSRLFHNRAFYPGEYDFSFTEEALERGHVIVALCEP